MREETDELSGEVCVFHNGEHIQTKFMRENELHGFVFHIENGLHARTTFDIESMNVHIAIELESCRKRKEGKYEGQTLHRKPNGSGVEELTSGDKYYGDFRLGERSGYGNLTFSNGDVYSGEFYRDAIFGGGRMKYSNGRVVEGIWIGARCVRETSFIGRVLCLAYLSAVRAESCKKAAKRGIRCILERKEVIPASDLRRSEEEAEAAMASLLLEVDAERTASQGKRERAKKKKRERRTREKGGAFRDVPLDDSPDPPPPSPLPPRLPSPAPEEPTFTLLSNDPLEDPPDDFVCPITQDVMTDPVIASDGHTYERRAVEAWFMKQVTSPKSGNALDSPLVFPNHLIRRQIMEWQEAR